MRPWLETLPGSLFALGVTLRNERWNSSEGLAQPARLKNLRNEGWNSLTGRLKLAPPIFKLCSPCVLVNKEPRTDSQIPAFLRPAVSSTVHFSTLQLFFKEKSGSITKSILMCLCKPKQEIKREVFPMTDLQEKITTPSTVHFSTLQLFFF